VIYFSSFLQEFDCALSVYFGFVMISLSHHSIFDNNILLVIW